MPPSIPAGRTSFIITANGLEALRKLGSQWFSNDPKKAASLTKSAAEDVAVAAFGELIDAAKDLPQDLDVQNELIRRVEAKVQGQTRREHFYFPAQVFEQEDVTTISVGPVRFDRRTDWLKQVEQVAGAPLPWTKRVLDRWRTAPGLDFANPEPADQQAQTILDAVGPADWVATVVVEGRDRSRSHDCASVAVLIALDSLGLPLD